MHERDDEREEIGGVAHEGADGRDEVSGSPPGCDRTDRSDRTDEADRSAPLGAEERHARPRGAMPGAGPGGARPDFVRVGLLFYAALMAVALVWRMGFYGESIFFASASDAGRAASEGLRWGRDLGLGLGVGLAIVLVSDLITRHSGWGDRLARSLAQTLGPIGTPDALLLAVASGLGEELLFRGALQPRVGLVLASLLFGGAHFVPRRELLPWSGFALVVGLLFGSLFVWTGNLLAPVAAHTIVNAVNLPLLVRRYGARPAPDGRT